MGNIHTSPVYLVWQDTNGVQHRVPADSIPDIGTPICGPECGESEGEDMEYIGWSLAEEEGAPEVYIMVNTYDFDVNATAHLTQEGADQAVRDGIAEVYTDPEELPEDPEELAEFLVERGEKYEIIASSLF